MRAKIDVVDPALTGGVLHFAGKTVSLDYDLELQAQGCIVLGVCKSVTSGSLVTYTNLERTVPRIFGDAGFVLIGEIPTCNPVRETLEFWYADSEREDMLQQHLGRRVGIRHTIAPRSQSTPDNVFLEELYRRCAREASDAALDLLLDKVDDLLDSERFSDCDRLLDSVDVERVDVTTALGFLSTTKYAKTVLQRRTAYIERVRKHLTTKLSAADAASLLERLV